MTVRGGDDDEGDHVLEQDHDEGVVLPVGLRHDALVDETAALSGAVGEGNHLPEVANKERKLKITNKNPRILPV